MNQAQFLGFIVLGFLAASIESGRKIYTVSGKITFKTNPEIEGLQHISMLHTDDPAIANVRQANYRQSLNRVVLSECLQKPCDYQIDIDDQNGNKVYLGLKLGSLVVFEYDGISAPEGANQPSTVTKNLIYEKSKSKHVVYIEGSPTQGHPPKPKPGPVGKMPDPLYTISGNITVEAKPGTDGNQTASLIHTTDSEYVNVDGARGYRQSMDRVKLSDCLQSPCSYKTSIYESDHKDGSKVYIGLKLGGQIAFLTKNEGIIRPAAGTKNVVKNMKFVISDAGYTLKSN